MERLAKPAAPQNHASKVPHPQISNFAIASSDRGVINRCDSFLFFKTVFSSFPFGKRCRTLEYWS